MVTVVGDGFALVGIQLAEGTAALVRTGPEGEVDWWESYTRSRRNTTAFRSWIRAITQ